VNLLAFGLQCLKIVFWGFYHLDFFEFLIAWSVKTWWGDHLFLRGGLEIFWPDSDKTSMTAGNYKTSFIIPWWQVIFFFLWQAALLEKPWLHLKWLHFRLTLIQLSFQEKCMDLREIHPRVAYDLAHVCISWSVHTNKWRITHNAFIFHVSLLIKGEALLTIGYANFSHVTIVFIAKYLFTGSVKILNKILYKWRTTHSALCGYYVFF
jgi:hypothetical protein